MSEPPPDAARPRSRRRRGVLAVLGVVAIAAASYLVGSGFDLGRLADPIRGSDDTTPEGDWGSAVVVAADDADGIVARVLIAPAGEGDGRCVRIVVASADGAEDRIERCSDGTLNRWDDADFAVARLDDYFGSFSEHAVPTAGGWAVALSGAVHPDVVRVTAHFGDGSQYSFVTRNPGGWFVTVLPHDVADPDGATGALVNAPVSLELFGSDGTRVASVDLLDATRPA